MTGLIILAAGASSRLGQPKQNLPYKDGTLLQRAIASGLESVCRPTIVVLGANARLINLTSQQEVNVIYNTEWQEGMASSIRAGVNEIEKDDTINQVIIMLCDQPLVDAELINKLVATQSKTTKPIVACFYNHSIGVPALFHRSFFVELLQLQGQQGAKKILQNYPDNISILPFYNGSIDIDTIGDYENLIKLK